MRCTQVLQLGRQLAWREQRAVWRSLGCQYTRRSSTSSTAARQWSTPLAKKLADAIEFSQTTGPISIAAYMRQCLTSPGDGYYTSKTNDGRDQFGQKGDFVTSPEISQIFGELLGIWIVAEWMAQGRKGSGVEIIEVGPGRGTLIDDILRTVRNFKPLASSIESIYLVEASQTLREAQKKLLCGDEAPMKEIDIGYRSPSKYSNIPVTWVEDIRILDTDPSKTPFIIAHEFFDALPIHAFQSIAPNPQQSDTPQTIQGLSGPIEVSNPQRPTSASQIPQWRELVVTPTPSPSSQPVTTTTSSSRPALASSSTATAASPSTNLDFQLSLFKASNPSSLLLPELSPRYKALKNKPDSVIEISPESHAYAADFARRIGGGGNRHGSTKSTKPFRSLTSKDTSSAGTSTVSHPFPIHAPKPNPSGAALIIDYGPLNTIPTSTLRGIRAHQLVSPFSSPGRVDLSADVDFTALAEAAIGASEGVEVHGPVEQWMWLERMGIRERAEMLIRGLEKGREKGEAAQGEGEGVERKEERERIRKAVDRLVERGGGGMGKLYKVLAIVPENGGKRPPVGFGGGVQI
ncbi:hypothetical protein MMC25_007540 [Agyrium rufum]|nr:hypothetical protein [Agyrium rufum]